MRFTETPLKGAFILDIEKFEDNRGFFSRSFSADEFAKLGLNDKLVQCNISYNNSRGTLRGMHFQDPPFAEDKLVRCTMGALYDVIVDIRPESPTFCKWFGVELTAENRRMVYAPIGFAHGFITLVDQTEIFYQMSQYYSGPHARGYLWNDPAFGINWPIEPTCISDRDQAHARFIPTR